MENSTEIKKIKQVARDYEKQGYQVIVEPNRSILPSFLRNYQPDIIAKKKNDNVIIEVKDRADLKELEDIKEIAEVVNQKINWRFELIVVTRKTERSLNGYNLAEIKQNLEEIKELTDKGILIPAFILGWANLESLAREILWNDKKSLNSTAPLSLIKTLYSLGHIDRIEYKFLDRLFTVRNQVVHGYKTANLETDTVRKLIEIINNLLNESEKI